MIKKLVWTPMAVATVLATSAAFGQVISEDFSGTTLPASLQDAGFVPGATPPSFDGNVIAFGTATGDDADPDRAYVKTVDTFGLADFTTSIDVEYTETAGAQGFFGIGPGDTDAVIGSGGSFGEPSNGPAILVGTDSEGFVRYSVAQPDTTGLITSRTEDLRTFQSLNPDFTDCP